MDKYGKLSAFTSTKDYCDVYTYGEVLVPLADRKSAFLNTKGDSFATAAVAGLVVEYAIRKNINRQDRQKIIMTFFKKKKLQHSSFAIHSARKDFLDEIKMILLPVNNYAIQICVMSQLYSYYDYVHFGSLRRIMLYTPFHFC